MRFTNGFGMPIHESRRIKKKTKLLSGSKHIPKGFKKSFWGSKNLPSPWKSFPCFALIPARMSPLWRVPTGSVRDSYSSPGRQGAMVLNRKSGGPELGGWLKRGNTWLQALVFLLRPIASQCKAQCTSSTSIYICISLSWALYVKCAQHSCYDLVRFHQTQKQGRNTLFS